MKHGDRVKVIEIKDDWIKDLVGLEGVLEEQKETGEWVMRRDSGIAMFFLEEELEVING